MTYDCKIEKSISTSTISLEKRKVLVRNSMTHFVGLLVRPLDLSFFYDFWVLLLLPNRMPQFSRVSDLYSLFTHKISCEIGLEHRC